MNWVFDAVRQFGADAAMQVVEAAKTCSSERIVAFGIGGDEMSVPTAEFCKVYERAGSCRLHRLIHAGEIGGPEKIREAIELLGVERIGHGITAVQDDELIEWLAERRIPLEVCPGSNVCTGALAKSRRKSETVRIEEHPLPELIRHGVPVTISTDDPAMFHTSLAKEYEAAHAMGLTEEELETVVENSFRYAFGRPR